MMYRKETLVPMSSTDALHPGPPGPELDDAPAAALARRPPAGEVIRASHERSALFGLQPNQRPEFDHLPAAELTITLERARLLRQHAVPVIEALYQHVEGTDSMIVLTDAAGTILHTAGDGNFIERARTVALAPGVSWSERTKGTNAIGTALAAGAPTVVHADQHFLTANHFLTCSACPIDDPQGERLGVLDVSGDFRSYHQHTLALVRMSARLIENQLFSELYPDAVRVHFQARASALGTLLDAIAVFAPDGHLLAANRAARALLRLEPTGTGAHTFNSLFDAPLSVLDQRQYVAGALLPAHLADGTRVFLKAEQRVAPRWVTPGFAVAPAAGDPQAALDAPALAMARGVADASRHQGRSARLSSLAYLNTGDPQMQAVIEKLRKVIGHDIPILMIGETGTGKELLARAIHNDSARAGMPFVDINCASLPETLIEAELFGYAEGAFTGARRRGNAGKIAAANGGTLFLDEIGDMPVALQARLLRVLQERVVAPLGGGKGVAVDLMLICATNRNPRELIARGEFREDLYYRLNGVTVRLPPLRDRTDLSCIVDKVLAKERHDGARFRVSAEVLGFFHRLAWPGNFRQLANVLRAAMVNAGEDGVIRPEHLPDDLLEELRAGGRPAPGQAIEHASHSVPAQSAAPHSVPAQSATPHRVPTQSAALSTQGGAARAAEPLATAAGDTAGTAPGAAGALPQEPDWQPGQSMGELEVASIRQALERFQGNVSAAARALGISRNTIYRKLPDCASPARAHDAPRRTPR